MLKHGSFIDKHKEEYTVFIMETAGYYRIDFLTPGADFQTDVDAVKFSRVKTKRSTFTYGEPAIYEDYLELLDLAHNVHAPYEKSSYWKDGAHYLRNVQVKDDISFMHESIMKNGTADSVTIKYGHRLFMAFVVADYTDMKLEPLNFSEYEEDKLESDTTVSMSTPYYPLNVLRARYDIAHLESYDYTVVTDDETARRRLQRWINSPAKLKGVDTETTGLDMDMLGSDEMVGVILSYDEDESTYFPFRHKNFPNLSWDFFRELMEAILAQEDRLVAHNKMFERKVFRREGWDVHIKWDTRILSFMVNPIIERGAHALKTLTSEMDGKKYLELEDIFTSAKLIDFSILPLDIVKIYACPDASKVIPLHDHLYQKLPKYTRRLYEVECALADVKADQEYFGMRVDVAKFQENLQNCDYIIDALTKAFRMLTGLDGNINSTAVLSDLMYNKMRCPVLMRTPTGKPSTGAKAVVKLAKEKAKEERAHTITSDLTDLHGNVIIKAKDLNEAKYPALVVLEQYRVYVKLRTAFYSRFERTMNSGRIFFWINQNGATSGRQSSPMHQLPPELKSIILSDSEDFYMWDPDYSQIELRMIAFLAGEKDLIELCCDPENDIHRVIGSLITGKEMWAIDAEERSIGKRRNFGVVYLISEYGLANQMFGAGASSNKEQVAIAKNSLDEFFHRFKRIRRYIAENGERVQKDGFITTFFGRNKYFYEIFDPDITSKRRASLIRQANNTPVQGSAADYLKIAEVNMDTYIRSHGWDKLTEEGFPYVRVALSIHDEVIIMSHHSVAYEDIITMVKTCMEVPVEGAPPFFSSPALVDTWEDHSNDAVAIPIKLRNKIIDDWVTHGKKTFVRSRYKVSLSHEHMKEIKQYEEEHRKTAKPVQVRKEVIGMYADKLSAIYLDGDNGTVLSDKGRHEALARLLDNGSSIYTESTYMDVLDTYRDNLLNDYMHSLIRKYGDDPDVVCKHVTHPSLTHELISRYRAPKNLRLNHVEQIQYATKQYMEGAEVEEIIRERETSETSNFFDELEPLVNFDANGEVVFEVPEEEEEYTPYSIYDDERFITDITGGSKSLYVWELSDAVCVDLQSISMESADKIIKELWKYKDDDGFFRVLILFNNTTIDAGFRVEDIPFDEFNNMIEKESKVKV